MMPVTFGRCATDPALLGDILGAETYLPMRAVIKAARAEPLNDAELAAFATLAGGRAPPSAPVSTLAIVAGRGAGKSEGASTLTIYMATCVRWPAKPGQVPVVLLLAADREQAAILLRYVRGQLEASPLLSQEVASITASRIELRNGVAIQVGTSDHVAVRGPTYSVVIADELCYWPTSLTSASPDVEIVTALRPGLARMPGSLLVMVSSPYAQAGVLYEVWRRSYGQDDAHTLVVHGGTRAFNAAFPQAEIDRALAEDAARFSAEYLAAWRTDIAVFIDAALVDSNTRTEPRELPRRATTKKGTPVKYVGGLDASGGRGDATCAAVAHLDDDNLVVVDACRRWAAPHDPAVVARQAADFLAVYGLRTASADQYAAGFARTVYQAVGVALLDAPGTRSDAYLHLLPLLTQSRVELPPDPVLRTELLTLERRTRSGGKDFIDHRTGAHDDLANAVALAAWAAARAAAPGGPPAFVVHRRHAFIDGAYFASDRF